MHMRGSTAVGVAIALAALVARSGRAEAQSADNRGIRAPGTRVTARWLVAVGTDPFEFDLRTRDPGVHGQLFGTLGRQWSRATSGLGFRGQLTAGADLPHGLRFADEGCGECEVHYRRAFGTLAGLATYEWRRGRAIQPYVLGGPSLHFERTGGTVDGGNITPSGAGQLPPPLSTTRWSLGVGVGAGVAVRKGRSSLFIEHSLQMPEAVSNWQGRDRVTRPLSIGFRF
jgi:hypothetical protein